jgi:hypothetical protein
MKQTFYSNGKLLITGEYLVLDGTFALPTKFGQSLIVEQGKTTKYNGQAMMLMVVFGSKQYS